MSEAPFPARAVDSRSAVRRFLLVYPSRLRRACPSHGESKTARARLSVLVKPSFRTGTAKKVHAMQRLLFCLAIVATLIAPGASTPGITLPALAATQARADLRLFSTEQAAQARCPNDKVVWLNTRTGIYHEKGMRWYGNTKQGAYVCRKEADATGDRDTRNGQ